jgi:hypothetical protein
VFRPVARSTYSLRGFSEERIFRRVFLADAATYEKVGAAVLSGDLASLHTVIATEGQSGMPPGVSVPDHGGIGGERGGR